MDNRFKLNKNQRNYYSMIKNKQKFNNLLKQN